MKVYFRNLLIVSKKKNSRFRNACKSIFNFQAKIGFEELPRLYKFDYLIMILFFLLKF